MTITLQWQWWYLPLAIAIASVCASWYWNRQLGKFAEYARYQVLTIGAVLCWAACMWEWSR